MADKPDFKLLHKLRRDWKRESRDKLLLIIHRLHLMFIVKDDKIRDLTKQLGEEQHTKTLFKSQYEAAAEQIHQQADLITRLEALQKSHELAELTAERLKNQRDWLLEAIADRFK